MTTSKLTPSQADALVELTKRQLCAIEMFRSQKHQDAVFTSQTKNLLVLGGNRAGKSLCAAVKAAAVFLDKEITLSDGTRVRARKPSEYGQKLRVFIMAYDGSNIGRNIHRLLFQPGAYKIIRDKKTRQWRAFDFQNKEDVARKDERRDAPPLIPARCIVPKSWAWEQKSSKTFKQVSLQDPVTKEVIAEIYAFSSKAERPAGTPIHFCWIDEQLDGGNYAELEARLTDLDGRIQWSSWPRPDSPELVEMHNKCIEHQELTGKDKLYESVTLSTSANMQLDEDGKKGFLNGLSEEERASRDRGEFNTASLRSYPLFATSVHTAYETCASCRTNHEADCTCKDRDDEVAKILRRNNGQPPPNWTREMVLDPGTSNPAVLFCAIPPPQLGDYRIVYDELVPGKKDAKQLAPLIKQKMGGKAFNRFIIDYNAGRQQPMSFGMTIESNYAAALSELGIKCTNTGSRFSWGSNDVGGRIMELQSWMHLDDTEKPKLRIVTDKCPELCKQLTRVLKKVLQDQPVDTRHADKQRIDTVHCLEYWAAARPIYIEPPKDHMSMGDGAYKFFMKLKKSMTRKNESESDQLGPQYEAV